MLLQNNSASHWLGANIKSVIYIHIPSDTKANGQIAAQQAHTLHIRIAMYYNIHANFLLARDMISTILITGVGDGQMFDIHGLGTNHELSIYLRKTSQSILEPAMLYLSTNDPVHYSDVMMGVIASQITSVVIIYSTVDSGADQRKYQSSASLAFVQEIHRRPVNSPHKWSVTPKMFPIDDVIMLCPSAMKELCLTLGNVSRYGASDWNKTLSRFSFWSDHTVGHR